MVAAQALVVAVFVAVHLFGGGLKFLDVVPRSRWLSMAGGISVAYVFVHVLPELAEAQALIEEGAEVALWLEHHAYLVALLGLTVFYGLERVVKSRREPSPHPSGTDEGETPAGAGVFWLHVASFSVYNALIGYLLVHREEPTERGLALYATAMTLHFMVTDYGLRQDHRGTYRRVGRWVLAAAIVGGWALGLAVEVGEPATYALFAFLAGGVVLNVLKEELPRERQSSFSAFLAGVAAYTAVLLTL